MDLEAIRKEMTSAFLGDREYVKAAKDGYSDFSYPKLIKFMKFHTERYRVPGFGHFMTMQTHTAFGMELMTASFMPGEGVSVPYCLIDIMTMGKKRTVFVEYYDCRAKKGGTSPNGNSGQNELAGSNEPFSAAELPGLDEVAALFSNLQDYEEKPKWYVSERAPYSLIKCGDVGNEKELEDMILSSVRAYSAAADEAGSDPANIAGLEAFRGRMINEGNPSSSVLEKVFGAEGAKDFFKSCVMQL